MGWLSYLLPQTVARFSSRYNHDIRLVAEYGRLKLLVNGSRQSGAYIEKLWRSALAAFGITAHLPIRKLLVLGVAGGTVIKILSQFYPESTITGVDIDPVMLAIGKKYFGLGQIKKLKLIKADARSFINSTASRYDLMVVDLFLGRQIPTFVTTSTFLASLKSILTPGGRIVINYLRELEYQEKSEVLYKQLQKIFRVVRDKPLFHNRFFCAS